VTGWVAFVHDYFHRTATLFEKMFCLAEKIGASENYETIPEPAENSNLKSRRICNRIFLSALKK
jgi:hypothetical protein